MMWGGIAKDGWRLSEPYLRLLTFQAPTPQNGQTHSNNSLAIAASLHGMKLKLG